MVVQLLQDLKDVQLVNERLAQMYGVERGYNVGKRLAEDFLSRTIMDRCTSVKETAEALAKSGFAAYMGVQPQIDHWSDDGNSFSLIINDNPLADFVELPGEYKDLFFSNIIAGAVRGSLETLQVQAQVSFLSDKTKGDEITELRIQIVSFLDDLVPPADD